MYSRRTVALLFQNFEDVGTVVQGIKLAPTYVDRIYVLDARDPGDGPPPDLSEVIASEPEHIVYLAAGNATPVALAATYSQVIRDGFDLVVMVVGDNYFDYTLLPYLIDPIVWNEADFVRGIKHTTSPSLSPEGGLQSSCSYYVEQTRIFPWTPEGAASSRFLPTRKGVAAISRDGLEIVWQELLKERFWRTLAAVPCYNEAMMIASVVLRTRAFVNDVLIVDDGSSDTTAAMAKEAGAIVVTHKINRGYGGALRTCFEYARDKDYDVMIILDGDGQHNPANIPEMLQKMKETGADIVIGSRFLGAQAGIPIYRRVGQKVLNLATHGSGRVSTTDTQCGFRAYGPKAIERISISDDSMGAGSEILSVAEEQDLQLTEIPIHVRYDLKDTSSQHPITHGIDVLGSIIWRKVTRRPIVFIALPGFLLTFAGLYRMLVSIQSLFDAWPISTEVMMVALLILITGTVALFMGLTIAMLNRTRSI